MACSYGEIPNIFGQPYHKLFSSTKPVDIAECLAHVEKKVDENMNNMLTKEFTADEVITIFFYQKHWNTVGDDITRAVLEVLNSTGDLSNINETYIVLIPKIKKP